MPYGNLACYSAFCRTADLAIGGTLFVVFPSRLEHIDHVTIRQGEGGVRRVGRDCNGHTRPANPGFPTYRHLQFPDDHIGHLFLYMVMQGQRAPLCNADMADSKRIRMDKTSGEAGQDLLFRQPFEVQEFVHEQAQLESKK